MKHAFAHLLFFVASFAHAQSVDWNRAWSGCSAETREFDAEAPGSGTNSRKVKEWVENNTGSPSTNVAGLQRKMEEDRDHLSDRNLLIRLSAKLAICGSTAALKQLQSGSTQSAAAAPSRPASPPPSTRGSGRNQPDKVAAHCMDDVQSQPGVVRNTCNQQVSMRWCSLSYGPNACGSGNLGWADVPPGGTAVVDRDVKILMIACAAPTRPTDIEYTPGGGFLYNCTQ